MCGTFSLVIHSCNIQSGDCWWPLVETWTAPGIYLGLYGIWYHLPFNKSYQLLIIATLCLTYTEPNNNLARPELLSRKYKIIHINIKYLPRKELRWRPLNIVQEMRVCFWTHNVCFRLCPNLLIIWVWIPSYIFSLYNAKVGCVTPNWNIHIYELQLL